MTQSFFKKNKITSIAIGGFDGMHQGHQALFNKLDKNGAVVVIETGYANLTPKTNRQEYTSYPIVYYPLENIKHLEGIEFVNLLLEEFPKLNKIVVGFDFCFGKNRKYCINELKELFKGELIVLDEVTIDNIGIHSRIIREHISIGDIKTANRLLGKSYKIRGSKISGQGLGKKEFVPTINLYVSDFLLPNEGIYATKTVINEKEYYSVTFLGHRVTTDNSYAVETHIIDRGFNEENILNAEIIFFQKLRENKKFDSFNKLKEQILKDIEDTKDFFNKKDID